MNLREWLPKLTKEMAGDGTIPGRKFLMGRYTILLATLGFLATALSGTLSLNFMTFITGLGTLYAIYCGGNVGNKWVEAKPATVTQVITDRRKEPEEWQADVNARLTAIETLLNTIQGTLNKFPTKVQLNAMTNIRQQEIDELKQRVTALEAQVAALLSNA